MNDQDLQAAPGDAAPGPSKADTPVARSYWPLVMAGTAWLGWVVFLFVMMLSRLHNAPS